MLGRVRLQVVEEITTKRGALLEKSVTTFGRLCREETIASIEFPGRIVDAPTLLAEATDEDWERRRASKRGFGGCQTGLKFEFISTS